VGIQSLHAQEIRVVRGQVAVGSSGGRSPLVGDVGERYFVALGSSGARMPVRTNYAATDSAEILSSFREFSKLCEQENFPSRVMPANAGIQIPRR
jgi:hypothetical protein